MNKVRPSPRLGKYAPLMNAPFESYYYSRTSNPGAFFNSRGKELYQNDFMHSVDREFSTRPVTRYLENGSGRGYVNQMLYADTKTSLPDDLLLKADKMTMANSVELRVPFLDHKFLEFAASLPENFKVRGFTTKYVAKLALRNTVPQEILRRKKVGFPVPNDSWMRNELKDWVRDVLLDSKTLSRGYFKKECIEYLIDQDQRFHTRPKEVLSLVALELWHRSFADGPANPTSGQERVPQTVAH